MNRDSFYSLGRYYIRGMIFVVLYQVIVETSGYLVVLQSQNDSSISLFFLAPGLSLAFLIFYGPQYFVFLAVNPLYNTIINERPLFLKVSLPLIIPLVYGGSVFLLKKMKYDHTEYTVKQTTKFIIIGIIAPFIVALLSQFMFLVNDRITFDQYLPRVTDWYIGDVVGIFTLYPLLAICYSQLQKGTSIFSNFSLNPFRNQILSLFLVDSLFLILIFVAYQKFELDLVFILIFPVIFASLYSKSYFTIFIGSFNSFGFAMLLSIYSVRVRVIEIQAFIISIVVLSYYLAATVEDKTKLKQRLADEFEVKRKSQEFILLGKLAGGIYHDLSNVLMAMGGQLDLLKLNHDLGEDASELEETLQLGNNLARQLRTITQIKNADYDEINLNEKIHEMDNLLHKMVQKEVNIMCNFDQIQRIKANSVQIEQILMNLVINASEAITPPGKIEIFTKQNHEFVNLIVKDTGTGIDEETQKRMFDILYSTKSSHSGFGLWIISEIMSNLNGKIDVKSTIGEGTEFVLSFPSNQ